MSRPTDLVQGTVDLLILKTIALEPLHGWAIAQRIRQLSDDILQVQQGTLYPALVRLEQRGWIKGAWRKTENNRDAKFYAITKAGTRALGTQTERWRRLAGLVNKLLVGESP